MPQPVAFPDLFTRLGTWPPSEARHAPDPGRQRHLRFGAWFVDLVAAPQLEGVQAMRLVPQSRHGSASQAVVKPLAGIPDHPEPRATLSWKHIFAFNVEPRSTSASTSPGGTCTACPSAIGTLCRSQSLASDPQKHMEVAKDPSRGAPLSSRLATPG